LLLDPDTAVCCAGQLSALLDYIGALLLSDDQQQATLAAIHRALQVVEAVGERYRQQKDLLSLVLLYESAQVGLQQTHGLIIDPVPSAVKADHDNTLGLLDSFKRGHTVQVPLRCPLQALSAHTRCLHAVPSCFHLLFLP
jgi:hypothetical protein